MAARIVFTSDIDHFTSFKINMAGDFLEMTIVFFFKEKFICLSPIQSVSLSLLF